MFNVTVEWSTRSGKAKVVTSKSRSLSDAIRSMMREDPDLIFPHSAIKVPEVPRPRLEVVSV